MWLQKVIFVSSFLLSVEVSAQQEMLNSTYAQMYERCVDESGGEQTCVFAINALRVANDLGVPVEYQITARVPALGLVVFELLRIDQHCSIATDRCVVANHGYLLNLSESYDRGEAQATVHRATEYGPMVWASLMSRMR